MQSKEYKLPNGKISVFQYDSDGVGKVTLECMDELMSMIADRPQGEWKGYNADKGGGWLRNDGTPVFLVCDKCYGTVTNNGSAHWNFCPNCGCRMKGASNGEDIQSADE